MEEMNNLTSSGRSYFNIFVKYIKNYYKIISLILITFFVLFLSYQFYSYLYLKNIQKNSIVYFNSKDFEPNNDFYKIMETLSKNKDFFSILAILEMIDINIKNKNYDFAKDLYLKLLEEKKINPIYVSAIASRAAYSYINIISENSDINLIYEIKNFINYIDDNLTNYEGVKLELKYLLAVAEQDINNISPLEDMNAIEIYKLIMSSENISSTIKERVNKIHEFQIYK